MPPIHNRFLDCAVYLYASEEEANRGQNAGATGFLVSMPAAGARWLLDGICPRAEFRHLYVVTNRHNIQNPSREFFRPKTAVRLNTHEGATSVIPAEVRDWVCSDDHDLAVLPIDYRTNYKYLSVAVDSFVRRQGAASDSVCLGDEVFMVGRFVNHEGKQRNMPSVRFGHISVMPCESEPVRHSAIPSRGQISFLVEVHSIPGYSGSPVFVRPAPVSEPPFRPRSGTNTSEYELSTHPFPTAHPPPYSRSFVEGPRLLGVEWGVIHLDYGDEKHFTGMAGVVPAWYLREFLDSEPLSARRREEQQQLADEARNRGTTPTVG